jgi:hypothetical protein
MPADNAPAIPAARPEGAAMTWEDPGRSRGPEPPAQGWWDWWLATTAEPEPIRASRPY